MGKNTKIREDWRNVANELVLAILWRDGELGFPTRYLHIYLSKLTKERTKNRILSSLT